MTTNSGGPAFPTPLGIQLNDGMTLRDHFASSALQGLLAHVVGVGSVGPDGYAKRAYEYADAMLKARSA